MHDDVKIPCIPRLWSALLMFGVLFCSLSAQNVYAGVVELSANFAYNHSNYQNESLSWTRRYGISVGYYFWAQSELEFSFEDSLNRTVITDFEDTTFHDQVFSLEWVQGFAPQHAVLQPYFKVGVGELNRTASGSYVGGGSPPAIYDSITGVFGVGLKVFFSRILSLRVEGSTYLIDGSLSSAQQNFGFNTGLSVYF